jgi:hypothetical protein
MGGRREKANLAEAGRRRDEARSTGEEAPSSRDAVQQRVHRRCCEAATLRPGAAALRPGAKVNFSSSPRRRRRGRGAAGGGWGGRGVGEAGAATGAGGSDGDVGFGAGDRRPAGPLLLCWVPIILGSP